MSQKRKIRNQSRHDLLFLRDRYLISKTCSQFGYERADLNQFDSSCRVAGQASPFSLVAALLTYPILTAVQQKHGSCITSYVKRPAGTSRHSPTMPKPQEFQSFYVVKNMQQAQAGTFLSVLSRRNVVPAKADSAGLLI